MQSKLAMLPERPRQLRNMLSVFAVLFVLAMHVDTAVAMPSPEKPEARAASALQACKKAFAGAQNIKRDEDRKKRYEDARAQCELAEKTKHSLEHIAWLAKIHQALGHVFEARELWGHIVITTAENSPLPDKTWREEALRQWASTAPDAPLSKLQQPQASVDLGRLANPGLPEDLARPGVESCASGMVVPGKHLAARVEIEMILSERGTPGRITVKVLPASPRGDDEMISASLGECIEKDLRQIDVPREAGSSPVTMSGKYLVMLGEPAGIPGQTIWVHGRLREATP